jgi:predicted nucleotidyltransferase
LIYTIKELTDRITPVAVKHGLPAVFIFGSYARGEAKEDSDVDILIDTKGTGLYSLFSLGPLYSDLENAVEKPIDLCDVEALEEEYGRKRAPWFVESVNKEKIKIYG